jgi:hypothetical protein
MDADLKLALELSAQEHGSPVVAGDPSETAMEVESVAEQVSDVPDEAVKKKPKTSKGVRGSSSSIEPGA